MVDYPTLNRIAPYIPYAITVIGIGAISFTAWYMSRKNTNYIDDLSKEFKPDLEGGNKIAEDITREVEGLHKSTETLSGAINSIEHSNNELTKLLSKIR